MGNYLTQTKSNSSSDEPFKDYPKYWHEKRAKHPWVCSCPECHRDPRHEPYLSKESEEMLRVRRDKFFTDMSLEQAHDWAEWDQVDKLLKARYKRKALAWMDLGSPSYRDRLNSIMGASYTEQGAAIHQDHVKQFGPMPTLQDCRLELMQLLEVTNQSEMKKSSPEPKQDANSDSASILHPSGSSGGLA